MYDRYSQAANICKTYVQSSNIPLSACACSGLSFVTLDIVKTKSNSTAL